MTNTPQEIAKEPGFYIDGVSWDFIEKVSIENGITLDEARKKILCEHQPKSTNKKER